MTNPYSVTTSVPIERGCYGDAAIKRGGTFLFRVIEVQQPLPFEFVYDGWWFRQKILIDGVRVWSQISWLSIRDRVRFRLPEAVDREQREGHIEINFGRGLRIRRFRLWIAGELIYDEVAG
jgi:hypothetical protein